MDNQNNKLLHLAAIGVMSYILADIIHEVVGHGGACLIFGNKIELLTSVYFKTSPGNLVVDMLGPISNLLFGGLTLYILSKTSFARLFLFQLSA